MSTPERSEQPSTDYLNEWQLARLEKVAAAARLYTIGPETLGILVRLARRALSAPSGSATLIEAQEQKNMAALVEAVRERIIEAAAMAVGETYSYTEKRGGATITVAYRENAEDVIDRTIRALDLSPLLSPLGGERENKESRDLGAAELLDRVLSVIEGGGSHVGTPRGIWLHRAAVAVSEMEEWGRLRTCPECCECPCSCEPGGTSSAEQEQVDGDIVEVPEGSVHGSAPSCAAPAVPEEQPRELHGKKIPDEYRGARVWETPHSRAVLGPGAPAVRSAPQDQNTLADWFGPAGAVSRLRNTRDVLADKIGPVALAAIDEAIALLAAPPEHGEK